MADGGVPQYTPTIIHNIEDHSLKLTSHPVPSPSPSQYLIAVRSTTFTNGELLWPEPNSLQEPIPGFDLAGVVINVPSGAATHGITYFQPGTRVYGLTSFSRHGNARGFTVAEHSELAEIPTGIDFWKAASIPLSALTAWQSLFDHAGLRPQEGANGGKRVLVTAASGGVGIWLVQLASWSGAHVVGTCGINNLAFVRSLGATEVLNYKTVKLSQWVSEDPDKRLFDVVVDCVGGDEAGRSIEESWTLAKAGGIVNSIAEPPDLTKPKEGIKNGVKSVWFIVNPNSKQLEALGELVVKGKMTPVVDRILSLNKDWDKAWERATSGHGRGKIVLAINDPVHS